MGSVESGCGPGSGDEEDLGLDNSTEDNPASAARVAGVGATGRGSRSRSSTTLNTHLSGPPNPGVLLEQVKLREAAGRISDSGVAIQESVLFGNEGVLMRWLEDRLNRGEASVHFEQFCEMLESRDIPREDCEEAFAQFDAEGDGVVEIDNMILALKNSNGANLQGELNHVIKQLQACSLTPGFIDIFSKTRDALGIHASKILKFLHRNRIPSSSIPLPILEGYNSICVMRSSVVQDFLEFLLQKEKDLEIQYRAELDSDPEVDKVKIITQCYSAIEASSNVIDIYKLTNGETASYWQSDGNARSHWIRLKLKPDVVLRRLSIAVASNDHSYMPQLIAVAVGKNRRTLQEIREIRVPSGITGYISLLENANIAYPYIQINIKRCLSDGCDTRIHGIKTLGYQITKNKEVTVSDASAIWYLSLLTSLVTTSMENNAGLARMMLQNTQKALEHMPPLSLSPSSPEFPKFFSSNILEEVDAFLLRIADHCMSPEAEITLLAFALARGSVAKVLQALSSITDHLETKYNAASLVTSMASVRLRLLYRNGKPLHLHLQACDVKSKEDKSGPENLLLDSPSGDGFLSESGKKRASVILSTENQTCFQVTQMKIKVRKGAIGAKCGLIFAYKDEEPFDAEKHFSRFREYDTWNYMKYKTFAQQNARTPVSSEDKPIGWFELEEEWNEVEIKLQQCRIAKFLMVKFLCTRQDSAERLGVQSLSFNGYLCPMTERFGDLDDFNAQGRNVDQKDVPGLCLLNKTLFFVQQLTQEMDTSNVKQKVLLDFNGLSLSLFWTFYKKLMVIEGDEALKIVILLLQLMQNCSPMVPNPLEPRNTTENADSDAATSADPSNAENTSSETTKNISEFYKHLCQIVDGPEGETFLSKALRKEAEKAIRNGAALFFPDKRKRRDLLFHMMKNITEEDQTESVKITFESLCTYFSHQDPSGLLLLPPKGAREDFDIKPILTVMETLLLVSAKECEALMTDERCGTSSSVLLSLFWSLQGSLISWCYLQLKSGNSTTTEMELASELILRYVERFLSCSNDLLDYLLHRHSSADISMKLGCSIFTTVFRQMMIFMLELCPLNIPHSVLLKHFCSMVPVLKRLSSDTGDIFSHVDEDSWYQPQQPVVLRTWDMESPHNYDNGQHETTVFACPGASSFEVEFDERCETEKRYDYLEFTDSRGGKVRYDMKVGSEKWPMKVTFEAGPQLQFLFHSDSSNNEWGYKFTVTAKGLPDITLSWISDLQLLTARLMGRLGSRILALKSPFEIREVRDLPPGQVSHVQSSPLWKHILRHGLFERREILCSRPPNDLSETKPFTEDDLSVFLEDFARWDPNQEPKDKRTTVMKTIMQQCKKSLPKNEIPAGPRADQAVNALWAVMVYHTPALNESVRCYVEEDGRLNVNEELIQVYSLAESIKTWMMEIRQKYLIGKMNAEDRERYHGEVTMETLSNVCIEKCLLLFRFGPCLKSLPSGQSRKRRSSGSSALKSSSCSDGECLTRSTVSTQLEEEDEYDEERYPDSSTYSRSSSSDSQRLSDSQGLSSDSVISGDVDSIESLIAMPGDLTSTTSSSSSLPSSIGRSCHRLFHCYSMEGPLTDFCIRERYPMVKHILNFMKDQALTTSSILHTLALNRAQAMSVSHALELVQYSLDSFGEPHLFQAPCILFLQELLTCQKDFTKHFVLLSDGGQRIGAEMRESYHKLILMLVEAILNFSYFSDGASPPALSCVQTFLLHLLDMNWELEDLPLFKEIRLPELLLSMSRENISSHDVAISQWSEEHEIADYKKNLEWMDECMDGMFEKWYDKIEEEETIEVKRKMHLFIARYCDQLNVVISCDGCEKMAPWHRYRCLECMDMDLCKTCFLSGAKPEGHENEHEMVNLEYACSSCQGLIVGSRISCNVCEDFDLCVGCFNAMKYPASHSSTHLITVCPIMCIRISDRHRLIQPYIHNYSWLLFSALALYMSELTCERMASDEPLDFETFEQALDLQTSCATLITECLLQGEGSKGVNYSTLLNLLSSNEFSSEPEMRAMFSFSSTESQSACENSFDDTKKQTPSSTNNGTEEGSPQEASPDHLSEDVDEINLVTEDTPDSASKDPSVSSEDSHFTAFHPPSECDPNCTTINEMMIQLPILPLRENVFSECSQERILGLLAAMLPKLKRIIGLTLPTVSTVLPNLFKAITLNTGSLNETYHLSLGLLGQLLLRISAAEADEAVNEALADKYNVLMQGDLMHAKIKGWRTVQLLFSLGAVCLDSRVGLDWACTVADILHSLNNCSDWNPVITVFTDHCIKQLPETVNRTNLFSLLVLVGFPEVLFVGAQAMYMDNANEMHDMILLKHFTEKNHAAVVDVKTRKRKTVKDYQLLRNRYSTSASAPLGNKKKLLSRHLRNYTKIISLLLLNDQDNNCPEDVEGSWVLALALKGLYKTLKKHGVEEAHEAIQESGLMKLLVRKCSKGTGFSKLWLLRDLEILSIMLYSSKKEIHCMAQEIKEDNSDQSSLSLGDGDSTEPLEDLDDDSKRSFQSSEDALNAPLPILRAMYELQMKRPDSFFLEAQKRYDGDELKTDEATRKLGQRWQPSSPQSEEKNAKAVDTDMIVVTSTSKPSQCDKATDEANSISQKLIANSESDIQHSYDKQRRSKSSALLHKELDSRSNRPIRPYLVKVNQAIATLYARHVLAFLLADWPVDLSINEEALELNGPSHLAYILDMVMQLEDRPFWEKVLARVLTGCSKDMLHSLSLTACQFMEEPGMAIQIRESKHPYDNNTNFEDKVHIPGAIYLSVKFDTHCHTEEGCDEVVMSSSSDFLQDLHNFSGSPQKWTDFEIPGDTLYYKFISDMSNTEWGYMFTVTGGHRGRFQTGFEILRQMLTDEDVINQLPLTDIWEWQVGIACRQTGQQRLKAIHLLLLLLQKESETAVKFQASLLMFCRHCDLKLLRPLWQLFISMEENVHEDPIAITVLPPLHRALSELFFLAESIAKATNVLDEYLIAMTTDELLICHTKMAVRNIAAISAAINYQNKATEPYNL